MTTHQRSVLDHINLPVSNLQRSMLFYVAILSSLDMSIVHREEDAIGFGHDTWDFGIVYTPGTINTIHVAFTAASESSVQQFHSAALQHGGHDNGGPGFRAEYGADYYAAYILDPDGHNIEAVLRARSVS